MTFDDIDQVKWQKEHGQVEQIFQWSRDKIERTRNELRDELESNPLLQQYIQHINTPQRAFNTHPWQALAERGYAAWTCLLASISDRIGVEGLSPKVPRDAMMISLAHMISRATPYLWCREIENLADAAPLPRHVVSRQVMPNPAMFWSRDSAYVQRDDNGKVIGENNWIALFYSGEVMIVLGDWTNEEKEELTIVTHAIPFGKTWPIDYDDSTEIARVLKRCAFLSSPYVDATKHRLARHHRRQMERANIPAPEREEPIHVVKLRRKSAVKPQPSGEPGQGVEWKHQWWVDAHYRAQWYPSEEAHKVIWIAPYLKGPPGLPVLEKVYAVVR